MRTNELHQNFSLKAFNTFGIESTAAFFTAFSNAEELSALLTNKKFDGVSKLILGGGSNILFTKNYDGLVLFNDIKGIKIIEETGSYTKVKFGSGENWHHCVLECIRLGLAGIENLSLIPGRIGAAPIQNIGAYGVELKDVFDNLTAVHLETAEVINLNKQDCQFDYRNSIFKKEYKDQFAIVEVVLKFQKDIKFNTSYGAINKVLEKQNISELSIKAISDAVIKIRSEKLPDPKVIGNSGSFFKNPVVDNQLCDELKKRYADMPSYPIEKTGNTKIPAGWLIEQCGFKGIKIGNTGTFKNQALVIINYGNATGKEIFDFSDKIIKTVKNRFGINLEREVNIV